MIPFVQDADFTLFVGDVRAALAELPDASVDCVVTSPPYWSLRDYGVDGQLGLEPTPDLYVEAMVGVFREVRRVLAAHGTCWLNLGDSYANFKGNPGANSVDPKQPARRGFSQPNNWRLAETEAEQPGDVPDGSVSASRLKQKDLVGIPWRVAFALQADGWYLRSDIVWSKPNPMPESVTDRPTKAHEYVFLLTRSPRYFFDQEAVREKYAYPEDAARYRVTGDVPGQTPHGATRAKGPDGRRATSVQGANGSIQHRDGERWPNGGRNIRSVWEIATQPYAEAHFATYPEELVRRCVLAGCPEGGVVLDPFCGSGTTPLVARRHGRRSIGIELNESYAALCAKRLQQLSLLAEGDAA